MNKFLLIVVLLWTAAGSYSQPGTLISAEGPVSMEKEVIYDSLLSAAGSISPELIGRVLHANFDVEAYKIIYATTGLQGNETQASGALFIPADPDTSKPLVAYLHGTLTRDLDAPSNLSSAETIVGWMFAMNGYITLLPDYLGMGSGEGPHPYIHKKTEATATLDFLKAVKSFLADKGISFINDLYLCGYSQGGHAAVATQQCLEAQSTPDITLKMNVAGSGPYYASNIQKRFMFADDTYDNASFLPYILTGYQAAYGNLYQNLSQVYVVPFDSQIPALFDGSLTVSEIDAQLPLNWKSIFQPAYLEAIGSNYLHPVNRALRANDLIRWKPETRLRLYYSTADELVDKDNSIVAWLSYVLQGASDVYAIPVGAYKHAEAATFVIFLAKSNFDCFSGVNPCPVDIKTTSNEKSTGMDEQTIHFFNLLMEAEKPDPAAFLSDPKYAGLMHPGENLPDESSPVIFPLPVMDKAWITIPAGGDPSVALRCIDATGRVMLSLPSVPAAGGLFEMDCSHWPAGIYILIMEGGSRYATRFSVAR